jgi:hypothetical protein
MLPLYVSDLLFSEYEFINDDYDVYSYKWYYLTLVLDVLSTSENSDTYSA